MTNESTPLDHQEHRAVVGLCVLAAFADGAQSSDERARIEQIVNGFSGEGLDLASVYQEVLAGRFTLASAASQIQTPASKALAYEMAVCVCHADGMTNEAEKKFLSDLQQTLQLDPSATAVHQQTAQALGSQPPIISSPPVTDLNREAEVDRMIHNAAIMNGALEIMPHTLATMAILPVQIGLVYKIGRAYGYELDKGHIKDFLATMGLGLTSQVFEGFTQKLVSGFARRLTGGLIGGLLGEAGGSAIAFASTYAIGQVAKKYYSSGRTLSPSQLKEVFATMLQSGRSMQNRYSGDIAQQSRKVNLSDLLPLAAQR
jgi:uncharacterized protein (DUF697 family)/tellurite resistance protein